jgi:hypothetical protein
VVGRIGLASIQTHDDHKELKCDCPLTKRSPDMEFDRVVVCRREYVIAQARKVMKVPDGPQSVAEEPKDYSL